MADTDSEPQVPAEDEEHSSHDSESGESEDSDESSEGSDMDVMEEACERGRETHPRVITSSWHIQLAYAAKKGECSWRSRIPQYQMERLREAGWSGKCYLRLDGLVESFEDKLCFPTVGKHEKGATIVAYAMPLFQERFLPLWIKSPSAISSWISYVKKNDRGVNATHAEVRSLDCPFKHGPERLKWLQQIFAEQQYGGGGKCEWGYKRVTHCSMTVGDIFIMGELVYPSAFDGFWVVNLNGHSECVRVEDTFGATLEEKASGSGDVRTDLQEALAASVAVAPEPVPKPKPKKMPGKGGFMSYDPPRLIRDAPINQDVKGGKGGKGEQEKGDGKGKGSNATVNVANDAVAAEAQLNLDVKGGKGEKEKGGGKGKGSNATGNVTNDAVAAEAQLNLDVKGGKGEKEKGGGKGRAKGEGKKGGKDSAAKGNWEKGYGKGKAKGKGKKDSNGHGKGANSPEHQQVMPEAQFNVDVPGGKGAWEKGYGKGRAKGKGKKGSNGKGANNAGHKDFTDVKGGKGYRNKGHGKGNAKGKGKKGGNGHGKGANDAEHQHMMPEAQFNLDVSGGKGERVKGNGKGKAKGKGKKGGKDFQAKGDWDKGYGKGSPKGNGKKGGKDFQAKGGWDKGYGKANAKGKGKKGFEQNIYM